MFSLIFLAIFLQLHPMPHFSLLGQFSKSGLTTSKDFLGHKGSLLSTSWPRNWLEPSLHEFTMEMLDGWFCATEKTQLNSPAGKIKITSEGIIIETIGWPRGGQLLTIPFLMSKGVKEFRENRRMEATGKMAKNCAINDDTMEFVQNSHHFSRIAPYCWQKVAGEQSKENPHIFESLFICRSYNKDVPLWQPKILPDKLAIAKTHGILSIGIVLPILLSPNCNATSAKIILPSGEYKLLVKKNDILEKTLNTLEDCLKIPPKPTTTTTTTTSTSTMTTSTLQITITTTTMSTITKTTTIPTSSMTTTMPKPTKWTFLTNRIEFFNGPTPYPPGTIIEMGGWNDEKMIIAFLRRAFLIYHVKNMAIILTILLA